MNKRELYINEGLEFDGKEVKIIQDTKKCPNKCPECNKELEKINLWIRDFVMQIIKYCPNHPYKVWNASYSFEKTKIN